jgi:hypothetical protein
MKYLYLLFNLSLVKVLKWFTIAVIFIDFFILPINFFIVQNVIGGFSNRFETFVVVYLMTVVWFLTRILYRNHK